MKLYDDQFIVITGGAGFIGSCVARHLNDLGYKNLIIVDDLGTSESWKNLRGKTYLEYVPKQIFFEWLKGREREIEAFIHLGASTSTVETNAALLMDNNYRFTIQLAEYALEHGHRFIYASSAATYGDGSQGFSDNPELLEKLHPINMYGYSKQAFDLWAKNQNVLDKVVGLKYFNVFGPNEYHKGRMASVIFHLVPKVMKEGVIQLFKSSEPDKYPDGGQCRDFIYVKDVVRMTCAFLKNNANGIFNIGSGVANTWNDLAKAIFDACKKPVNIQYVEMPSDLKGKYQNYTCADMKNTRQALEKDATCPPLKESVKDYVTEYLLKDKYW